MVLVILALFLNTVAILAVPRSRKRRPLSMYPAGILVIDSTAPCFVGELCFDGESGGDGDGDDGGDGDNAISELPADEDGGAMLHNKERASGKTIR